MAFSLKLPGFLKGASGMNIVGAGLGFLGSLGSASAMGKASSKILSGANDMMNTVSKMTEGYREIGSGAVSTLGRLTATELMPKVGVDSPIIAKEYALAKKGINRSTEGALGESSRYWGSTGNIGRLRGESALIGRRKETALSEAGLKYGAAQESYKESALDRVFSALGSQAELGKFGIDLTARATETGMNLMAGAYGMQGQSKAAPWDALSSVGGMVSGAASDKLDMYRTFDMLKKLKGMSGSGANSTSGATETPAQRTARIMKEMGL